MNLIRLSIRRPIFILMVTLFLIVLGLLALKRLPVDLYPEVSYPVLAVRANLAGAAPEEIEQLVTEPIEDVLASLEGLETIRSMSREGSSFVILEFAEGTDVKFQETQVRAKVANLRPSLPEDLSEPVVFRNDPDDTPIIELALTGSRTASELSQIAEDRIAERLRQVVGVGEVTLSGERKQEVLVELKPEALDAWRISSAEVALAIRNFNGNEPVGKLSGKDRSWLLRSLSPVKSVDDLRNIPVKKIKEGQALTLGEIATVTQGFAQVTRVSRISDGTTLRPAVLIDVSKQSGENTVQVSDDVLSALDELREELPPDISLKVTRDNADLVRSNVSDVFETLIIGSILTILVVLLFLRSPRATVTTGVSLPSSVITTFAVMAVAGFTVNIMTLLALSLAIGLLVDDAIVVRENIFRHLQRNPTDPQTAAYEGTREVSLAVVATTLTIVAVFLPVGFMGGTIGQFFKQFAVTVVFAIMISLWDAVTMAPMLSAYFANIADPSKEWTFLGRAGAKMDSWLLRFEHWFDRFEKRYKNLLAYVLPRPRIALGIGLGSVLLAAAGFYFIGKGFLPTQLGDVFSVSMNGPLAVPMEKVVAVSDEVEKKMRTVPGLEDWTITAGAGWSGNASVNLTVRVKPEFAHSQDSLDQVRTDVRQALDGFVGYTLRIRESGDPLLGGGSGRFQPVAVKVSGPELATLKEVARRVQLVMESVDGITDVAPLQDEGLPELRLIPNPEFAGHFGVTSRGLSEELRTWIEGDTRNSLQSGSERIPIRVRLKGGEHLSAPSLLAKSVFSRSADASDVVAVPLSSIVAMETGAGPSVIRREDRVKTMRVSADTKRGAPLGTIVSTLEEKLKELPLPKGYKTTISGQNEQMSELFSNVLVALGLGVLFMYMILASLFESFTQPISVLAAVPLAATGAVLALLACGMQLDMYGGIGMILLAGIVAKNSILLVDFAMQKVRDHGTDPHTAILEAAPVRLRPILMTSVAMIAGMLPVALGLGSGGAARQSLGIATIGGIISSTLLTLVVVPNLYVAVEGLTRRRKSVSQES